VHVINWRYDDYGKECQVFSEVKSAKFDWASSPSFKGIIYL
jgi:hypothetical protein